MTIGRSRVGVWGKMSVSSILRFCKRVQVRRLFSISTLCLSLREGGLRYEKHWLVNFKPNLQ